MVLTWFLMAQVKCEWIVPADATALERGFADARLFNLDSHRTILTNVSRTIQGGDMLVSDEISFLEYDI